MSIATAVIPSPIVPTPAPSTDRDLDRVILGGDFGRHQLGEIAKAREIHGTIKRRYLDTLSDAYIEKLRTQSRLADGTADHRSACVERAGSDAHAMLPDMGEQNERLVKAHQDLQVRAVGLFDSAIKEETTIEKKRFDKYGLPYEPSALVRKMEARRAVYLADKATPQSHSTAEGVVSTRLIRLAMGE